MFHIPWEFFPIVNDVREVGGKTLIHQTVHWKTDLLFKSKVLGEIDAWVAPTRWAEEQLRLVGKIRLERIKYIPHAVNVEKIFPHDTSYRKALNVNPAYVHRKIVNEIFHEHTGSPTNPTSAITAGDWSADTDLTFNTTTNVWEGQVTFFDTGEYKFRANDDWAISFGGALDNIVYNAGNLATPGAGTYNVTLDLSGAEKFSATVTAVK